MRWGFSDWFLWFKIPMWKIYCADTSSGVFSLSLDLAFAVSYNNLSQTLTHNGTLLRNVSQTHTFAGSSHNALVSSCLTFLFLCSKNPGDYYIEVRTSSETQYFENKSCDQIQMRQCQMLEGKQLYLNNQRPPYNPIAVRTKWPFSSWQVYAVCRHQAVTTNKKNSKQMIASSMNAWKT